MNMERPNEVARISFRHLPLSRRRTAWLASHAPYVPPEGSVPELAACDARAAISTYVYSPGTGPTPRGVPDNSKATYDKSPTSGPQLVAAFINDSGSRSIAAAPARQSIPVSKLLRATCNHSNAASSNPSVRLINYESGIDLAGDESGTKQSGIELVDHRSRASGPVEDAAAACLDLLSTFLQVLPSLTSPAQEDMPTLRSSSTDSPAMPVSSRRRRTNVSQCRAVDSAAFQGWPAFQLTHWGWPAIPGQGHDRHWRGGGWAPRGRRRGGAPNTQRASPCQLAKYNEDSSAKEDLSSSMPLQPKKVGQVLRHSAQPMESNIYLGQAKGPIAQPMEPPSRTQRNEPPAPQPSKPSSHPTLLSEPSKSAQAVESLTPAQAMEHLRLAQALESRYLAQSQGIGRGWTAAPTTVRSRKKAPPLEEDTEGDTLVSEVWIRDLDRQELEDKELEAVAEAALKKAKPNFPLKASEVAEESARIMETGFFATCLPVAEDTRDGTRLIFRVDPNHKLTGIRVHGASMLPAVVVEQAFRHDFGKVVKAGSIFEAGEAINNWYTSRGLFGKVSGWDLLSNGVIRLNMAETRVNNINIRYSDRKTGEPTTGTTQPETILRQLTTRRGQVYSEQQGRRDVETVFTMGIFEDVILSPTPSGSAESGLVDLNIQLVERVPGGFSAGGGLSGKNLINGALSSLIGSFAYTHRNFLGRNQKLNISLERGQFDSTFRLLHSDPWLSGDDKRSSRVVSLQNSRTSGSSVHGVSRDDPILADREAPWHGSSITVCRVVAGVDFSRPLRPNWSGTAGLSFQRAGVRDDHGQPKLVDAYGGQFTFSGKSVDDMLVAKLEMLYTGSGTTNSSQLVLNTEQGIPIIPGWLFYNRITARARQSFGLGLMRVSFSGSAGHVIGDLAPHEAFPIGGTNSVRGYDEGAVGSGRSSVDGSVELSCPIVGPLEGDVFFDYGNDLQSGSRVRGDPAGARGKPGKGHGYGAGIRIDSPLGPLRLELAFNDMGSRRFHFGIGYRN